MALVGFAIFHGHAHGAEMPESASGCLVGKAIEMLVVRTEGLEPSRETSQGILSPFSARFRVSRAVSYQFISHRKHCPSRRMAYHAVSQGCAQSQQVCSPGVAQ